MKLKDFGTLDINNFYIIKRPGDKYYTLGHYDKQLEQPRYINKRNKLRKFGSIEAALNIIKSTGRVAPGQLHVTIIT